MQGVWSKMLGIVVASSITLRQCASVELLSEQQQQ